VGVRRTYAFSGTWTVEAPLPVVQEALVDLEHYPEWWPQVKAVASLGTSDAWVLCRSALPYTLDLHLHAVRREPDRLEVAISGDLDGLASWRLTDLGGRTRLDFHQEVSVGGWLAAVSPSVRPLLRWNHARMMAGCLEGLRDRVVSRRA
jgi:carbon monoxide dehydrogenase subunit G